MKKRSFPNKRSGEGKRRGKSGGKASSGRPLMRPVGRPLVKTFSFLTVVVIISLFFLLLYHYLIRSPHLKLKQVNVQGVGEKIRNELIRMSDLTSDVNLLALNLRELKGKMESHPWVRTVTLERRFPHTLLVRAEKQTPFALVVMDGLYYMNRYGEIFKKVHKSGDMDFPIITGLSKKGSHFQQQSKKAVLVLKALELEKGLWSLSELSEIHVKHGKDVSLYFSHLGAEIKLICEDLENQIAGLKKVAKHLSQAGRIRQVKGIDLNFAGEAVVSFRKG